MPPLPHVTIIGEVLEPPPFRATHTGKQAPRFVFSTEPLSEPLLNFIKVNKFVLRLAN